MQTILWKHAEACNTATCLKVRFSVEDDGNFTTRQGKRSSCPAPAINRGLVLIPSLSASHALLESSDKLPLEVYGLPMHIVSSVWQIPFPRSSFQLSTRCLGPGTCRVPKPPAKTSASAGDNVKADPFARQAPRGHEEASAQDAIPEGCGGCSSPEESCQTFRRMLHTNQGR